ncbi:exopolysaccharide biosynthesis protein [Tateyamaria armeniaca]|uniref:Exopolysaccharide biosynthesis protein n=1 Tax=Tateyamaria armeniaca TaxID=2518930 RepID=A0ABW8V306_9RHOB
MSSKQPIAQIADTLEDVTRNEDLCLGDAIGNFGTAAFASTVLAIALLLVSPLSGVPLFSSACGIAIFLIAVQAAFGRQSMWLPSRLMCLNMASPRAEQAIKRIRSFLDWLDARSTARWPALVTPPMSRGLYAICAILGLILPLLELVPMTSSLIGVAISFIATGLLARDGLIAAIGVCVIPVVALVPIAALAAVLGQ